MALEHPWSAPPQVSQKEGGEDASQGEQKLLRLLDALEELRSERLTAQELEDLVVSVSEKSFLEGMDDLQLCQSYQALQGHQLLMSEKQGIVVGQVLSKIQSLSPEVRQMEVFREELREIKASLREKRRQQMR